ncbi:hypothetical protein [Aeoliella sp.]|uniref:hypothetical protein n=1 Tax=Aeoliella sp. TaxID=2795800 RepID=UPI003CCBD97A
MNTQADDRELDKRAFCRLLESLSLPTENVYEDLSALGVGLWHNDRLSLSVVWSIDLDPHLQLVAVIADGNYRYFGCALSQISASTIERVLRLVEHQSDKLHHAALSAENQLSVVIGEDVLSMSKLYQ